MKKGISQFVFHYVPDALDSLEAFDFSPRALTAFELFDGVRPSWKNLHKF